MLRDRHGDADNVSFLEGIRANDGAGDLTGDGHERNRVHVRIHDGRHQVRGAGAGRGDAHANFTRHHRVTLGRMTGSLLVADQNVV